VTSNTVAAEPAQPTSPVPPKAESTAETVIEVHDLCKFFGHFEAVKGNSFSVQKGQIFGLLGANGAGKSTTFRMLCGLLPASSGTLRVAGVDMRHASAQARARIGYVSQKFSLYGNLSCDQNLAFFSAAYGLRGAARRQRLDWARQEFQLQDYRDVNVDELPLGIKQRLALACALLHEPPILFLDEPTSGVDPLARREFWKRVNALAEAGVTVMITTHFMDEAEYCDNLVLMSLGEVLAQGSPEQVRAQARSEEHPDPSMEDAFILLIEHHESQIRRSS
jgi:ABC-2 type transport system ATP-binding protein